MFRGASTERPRAQNPLVYRSPTITATPKMFFAIYYNISIDLLHKDRQTLSR
ncbi:MAG: hypothetical protein M0Z54_15435 [Thermaerobacter sp.]|nr:hypothetical protein [Thermaerobacter sp.]